VCVCVCVCVCVREDMNRLNSHESSVPQVLSARHKSLVSETEYFLAR